MKLTKDYTLIAENIVVDDKNRATFVNVFDRIYATAVPTFIKSGYITTTVNVANYKDDFVVSLKVSDPEGEVVAETPAQKPELNEEKTSFSIIAEVSGMPINNFGKYSFEFIYKDQVIGFRQIDVVKVDGIS